MTKIFASPLAAPPGTDDNSNDGVKAKKDQDLYTVLQPTVFPVPVSQPALAKRYNNRNCRWILALIIVLWTMTSVLLFIHITPECVFKKIRILIGRDIALDKSDQFIFDIAEPNIKIASQLSTSENSFDQKDSRKPTYIVDGDSPGRTFVRNKEAKDKFTSAVGALLNFPAVDQILVVENDEIPLDRTSILNENKESNQENAERKPILKITEMLQKLENNLDKLIAQANMEPTQSFPIHPQFKQNPNVQMQISSVVSPMEHPLFNDYATNYQKALMQMQMQRELLRNNLFNQLTREQSPAEENEMPRFLMEPPTRHIMMQHQQQMPIYRMMFLPFQQVTGYQGSNQNRMEPTDSQLKYHRMLLLQNELMKQALFPQVERKNEMYRTESTELPIIHPHDASADQILRGMQSAKADRDEIFRNFRTKSQAAMDAKLKEQMQRQETQDEIYWKLQKISQEENRKNLQKENNLINEVAVTKSADDIFRELQHHALELQKQEEEKQRAEEQQESIDAPEIKNEMSSDEIFRKFQHRALEMQQEEDKKEAARNKLQENENDEQTSAPVIMIADSFPKRQTDNSDFDTLTTTPAPNVKANESDSDILSSFFKFFEKEVLKSEKSNSSEIEETAATSDEIPLAMPVFFEKLPSAVAIDRSAEPTENAVVVDEVEQPADITHPVSEFFEQPPAVIDYPQNSEEQSSKEQSASDQAQMKLERINSEANDEDDLTEKKEEAVETKERSTMLNTEDQSTEEREKQEQPIQFEKSISDIENAPDTEIVREAFIRPTKIRMQPAMHQSITAR